MSASRKAIALSRAVTAVTMRLPLIYSAVIEAAHGRSVRPEVQLQRALNLCRAMLNELELAKLDFNAAAAGDDKQGAAS